MTSAITLRPITMENFDEVVDLEVHEHQNECLANNVYSLAQAGVNPVLRPMAIYCGALPVGFLMYAAPSSIDEEPGCYGLWRLMIDRRHQRRGYGRKAMAMLVEALRAMPDANKIVVSFFPGNAVARALYADLGFTELAVDAESGEMEAVLVP